MSNRLISHAVVRSNRLDTKGLLDQLFARWFQNFVYNQIWEDPEVDLAALELASDSRLVTIASGGCNVLNYLLAGPAAIDAVDLNPAHIALTRLKLEGAQRLPDHDAFFRFFGAADEKANLRAYRTHLQPCLDADTRAYWDGRAAPLARRRISYFSNGLYRRSLLGLFIGFAHRSAKLYGVDPSCMLEAASLDEQRDIFDKEIAPLFDRKLIRTLCSLPVSLYSLGIPPAQFDALRRDHGGDVARSLRERLRRLACDFPIADNYFAWQAFGRRYDRERRQATPPYLQERHFGDLRARANRVRTHLISMTDFLAAEPASSRDAYVLLDAQDWMGPDQLNALWAQITRTARPGARVIFRTAAAHSPLEAALTPSLLGEWRYEAKRSRDLLQRDRSAIYGGFHLYRRA